MVLPLACLTEAKGTAILVELKSGVTLNGILSNCDNFMNLTLKEVIETKPDGDRFFRHAEAYVRGNNIKYLRIEDQVVEKARAKQAQEYANNQQGGRGATRGGPGVVGGRGGAVGGHSDRGGYGQRGMGGGGRGGGPRGGGAGRGGRGRGRG